MFYSGKVAVDSEPYVQLIKTTKHGFNYKKLNNY